MKAFPALLLLIGFLLASSSGCITAAKNLEARILPTEEPIEAPITPSAIAIATPTAPSAAYNEPEDLRMYRTGGRYLGEYFEVKRDNVTMQKDMDLRIKVYDYTVL